MVTPSANMHTPKTRTGLSVELFSRLTRYTRMVLFGKWALGVVSVLIIIAIIAIPLVEQTKDGKRISFVSAQPSGSSEQPVMLNPKLEGTTEKNEPFTATAQRAVQENEESVRLFGVQADMFKSDNSWLNLTANEGLYNSKTRMLELWGNVNVYQDNGYQFATPRVMINTREGQASSAEGISGQGSIGNLVATGYAIRDNGSYMRFGSEGTRVVVKILKAK